MVHLDGIPLWAVIVAIILIILLVFYWFTCFNSGREIREDDREWWYGWSLLIWYAFVFLLFGFCASKIRPLGGLELWVYMLLFCTAIFHIVSFK